MNHAFSVLMTMAAGCASNSTATSLEDQSDEFEDNPTRDTLTDVSLYVFLPVQM